ncbi:hypothetical protein G7K_6299-t1 [Saitoella complicata NRRL Y-17804]|uniref:Uncharacterized protein n=2 Tax=Saitoella complicata (strain BCRC 22490 / CBS 7301 / JCM 7358 / NBRC 10748 / NRRL Y-17804) TaxID=698492 RepID=A0A0E9NR98_SAICN|nr:hypothetical protein G7K_6299-t1 [Saitoella complicata NRRL Y-17804]
MSWLKSAISSALSSRGPTPANSTPGTPTTEAPAPVLTVSQDGNDDIPAFPLAHGDCNTCATPCPDHAQYPDSLRKTIEWEEPMKGSVMTYGKHFVIATGSGKMNWEHEVSEVEGTMAHEVGKIVYNRTSGKRTVLTNSSMAVPYEEEENKTDVLVLPDWKFVEEIKPEQASDLVSHFVDEQAEAGKGLKVRDAEWDAIVLICSHRKRDKRCGITAPYLRNEFERSLRSHNLWRDPDDSRPNGGVGVFFVSHIGGHKFAGNVIIYRKEKGEGIWYGKVEPCHVERIVEETVVSGMVFEGLLRGGVEGRKEMF